MSLGLAYFGADCPAECYPEGLIANRAIDVLDWHVNNPSQPFFFGCMLLPRCKCWPCPCFVHLPFRDSCCRMCVFDIFPSPSVHAILPFPSLRIASFYIFSSDSQLSISTLHKPTNPSAAIPTQLAAVGFKRPHVSYKTPKAFMDMYPLESVDLPAHPSYPENLPGLSYTHSCMAGFEDVKPYGLDLNCTADRCT